MISSITIYLSARSSGHHQCLPKVTIMVKVAMVTYIQTLPNTDPLNHLP